MRRVPARRAQRGRRPAAGGGQGRARGARGGRARQPCTPCLSSPDGSAGAAAPHPTPPAGAVPPSLAASGSLRVLRGARNRLTGAPAGLLALPALEVLDLSHNMLAGPLAALVAGAPAAYASGGGAAGARGGAAARRLEALAPGGPAAEGPRRRRRARAGAGLTALGDG